MSQALASFQKMRVNQGQEFVIAGYTPSPKNFHALVIGYYEGSDLLYAARRRNGFHTLIANRVVQKDQIPGDQDLPIRQFSGEEGRPMGEPG